MTYKQQQLHNKTAIFENKIRLTGTIEDIINRRHDAIIILSVKRLSGTIDALELYTDDYKKAMEFKEGDRIDAIGKVKTGLSNWNVNNEVLKTTAMYIEVDKFRVAAADAEDRNEIKIAGKVIKDAIYRETPRGRHITNLTVKTYGELMPEYDENHNILFEAEENTAFIPVICWERNASETQDIKKEELIECTGRLQSRDYIKTLSNGIKKEVTTFEISTTNAKRIDLTKE